MDDAIMQMVAVTATTPERARQYLQVTDGDVEQAVSLFFESGGVDLGATVPSNSGARTAGTGDASNPINIDDEGASTDLSAAEQRGVQAVGQGLEDDEAMARRLQEEAYGGTGAGGQDEPIRAPIARQTETLVGGASDYYGGSSLDEAVQQRMEAMQSRRGARRGPGIFNQQPTSRIWNQQSDREALAESTGGASESNARAQHLARLFAPNWALMFDGSWDDARDQGKSEKKWLLVNIQNEKVFDCQALNRDIWKNESVVGTIQENFIFLQYSKDDPRADQYCQYYFPQNEVEDEYPHIAIVDPRTGEQVKLWSKKAPGADDFLMQLYEFLDRYSLNDNARNPVAKRKSEAKKEKSFDMLTEEEQIERALQASLGATDTESSLKVPDEDPDDLTRSVTDIRQNDVPVADASKNGKAATDTPFAQIPSDRPHEEPPNGPDTTRIQLRHPDGRIVRRFLLNDPVQRIYEYLKATPVDGKDGKEFELVAMGKNLIEAREQTIDQAGLKMGTVMVEYID